MNDTDPFGIDNPFSVSEWTQREAGDDPEYPVKDGHLKLGKPRGGYLFIYDVETVPDESRFPRPTAADVKPAEGFSAEEVQKLTVQKIEPIIATLNLDQLDELEQAEISIDGRKGNREGVISRISKARAAIINPVEEWVKDLSVDPFRCRIVSMAVKTSDDDHFVMVAKDQAQEIEILKTWWEHIAAYRMRCGYNILGFDDLVMIIRSYLLGVDPTKKIDRRKYNNPTAIDLMVSLFPNGQAKGAKHVTESLGFKTTGDVDGSQVFELYEAGKLHNIAKYCLGDVIDAWQTLKLVQAFFT